MLDSRSVIRALKSEAEPHIYARGRDYIRRRLVKEWSAEEGEDGQSVEVTGRVRGSDLYEVTLNFAFNGEDCSFECSCPYDDTCKHIVALGLTFAQSMGNEQEPTHRAHSPRPRIIDMSPTEREPRQAGEVTDAAFLRRMLGDMGLASDALPAGIIEELLRYRKSDGSSRRPKESDRPQVIRLPAAQPKTAAVSKRPRFDPKKYVIVLDTFDFQPKLHIRDNPYEEVRIKNVRALEGLSPAQRELFTYLEENGSRHSASLPPDFARLLALLVESDIQVVSSLFSYSRKSLGINMRPEPLAAEIVYEPYEAGGSGKVRHDFFLRMPPSYWRKGRFHAQGASLVHVADDTVSLHALTPTLSAMIARMEPAFDYERSRAGALPYRETRFSGGEIAQFDAVVADASRLLSLTAPPPALTTKAATSDPRPAFRVEYDGIAHTLCVAPVIDYGHYGQDVSESVRAKSWHEPAVLERQRPFEHPATHSVCVENGVIHYAPVDEKKEKAFYRACQAKADEVGFTKTLKCNKSGKHPVANYLRAYWPRFTAFADARDYPFIFTKDAIAFERATFRADFAADIDADNDWLHFDVVCYCGDEKITLLKLLAYLKSGDTFFRRDDGTFVEFSNREELDRLARLLESFQVREDGGFEGRAYHAPELQYVMTSSEHYSAERAKSFEQFIRRVQKGAPIKKVRLPKALEKALRPYQKSGIEWLYFLRSHRFAGILADDMGLGKTLQTLSIVSMERAKGRPSLVVCPKTLLYNWKSEAAKFFPDMRVLVYDGTPPERQVLRTRMKKHDLVVASYNTVKQDEEAFAEKAMRFNYAILDEAQFIKNHATKNAQIVKKLNADYRLALTGTPLENSVSELWSIYDFLMPGFLGAYERFAKHFHRPIMEKGDRQALEHLRKKVECFMLRRTKAEVLTELPAKIEQTSQCHLSAAQNILYQQILASVRASIFTTVQEKGFSKAHIHILAGLTKLRQACNHPALLTKGSDFRKYESAKLDMCMELVEEVAGSKRKVLIFSQFTQMLDIVAASLADIHIPHLYLSGKTRNRQQRVDAFNTDPSIPVFLISLKAGGTGINLTAADTVIIFDPWWNPSVENQAIDRAHRIGQKKTVNVYRLLTQGTIEEKIQALKKKKQRLFDALVSESGDLFKKLTWDDVRELFADQASVA